MLLNISYIIIFSRPASSFMFYTILFCALALIVTLFNFLRLAGNIIDFIVRVYGSITLMSIVVIPVQDAFSLNILVKACLPGA